MREILVVVLLGLAACATADAAGTANKPSNSQDWRLPTGLPPSQAEYDALVAACRDKVHGTGDTGKIDTCLINEFGLRRSQ